MPLRHWLWLLAVPLAAQTITLSSPSVTVGQSITISSSAATTFTLTGSGTCTGCGVAGTSSVVYTAPSSVIPANTDMGCPVFPNDSIFNTRIDNLPVSTYSTAWKALLTGGETILPSWGISEANNTNSTPMTIKPYYGDGTGSTFPSYTISWPGRVNLNRENGSYVSGDNIGNDTHTVIVNRSTCTFSETYKDRINLSTPDTLPTFNCQDASSGCNVTGAIAPYTSATFAGVRQGSDAGNIPLAALTWTLSDLKNGVHHAGRFTQPSVNGCVWPTFNYFLNGNACGSTPTVSSVNVPYGARFRLKTQANGGPNIASVCGANTLCTNYLTGLVQYGRIMADTTNGNNQDTVSADVTMDPLFRQAKVLIESAGITGSSYDVVDESSLQETTANGFQLPNAYGSYAVDPGNSYVVPANYALIQAGSTKLSIPIQGVGIGMPSPLLAIAQGMGAYALPSWVTPSTVSQTVTWAKTSSTCTGDSISGTSYTPPTSGAPCDAVLTATASADTNVTAKLYVRVFALSGSGATAGYRFDIASVNGATTSDSGGNTWYSDYGIQIGGTYSYPNYGGLDYPSWVSGGSAIPEATQYETIVYSYGGDIGGCLAVPNGQYRVRWGYGQQWNNTGFSAPQGSRSLGSAMANNPNFIVNNGVIQAHFFDWFWPIGYQYATPSDSITPALVTNNRLCTSTRVLCPDIAITAASGIAPLYYQGGTQLYPYFGTSIPTIKSSQVALLELIPDGGTTPHWSIDSQGATRISSGQSIQLWVQDWYTGDSDTSTPTWSIVSDQTGLASISSTGLFSLASGAPFDYQPVLVKAQGASHSATLTLYSVGTSRIIQ